MFCLAFNGLDVLDASLFNVGFETFSKDELLKCPQRTSPFPSTHELSACTGCLGVRNVILKSAYEQEGLHQGMGLLAAIQSPDILRAGCTGHMLAFWFPLRKCAELFKKK